MPDIIIIGGGASGMMAALAAAQNRQNKIYLLERQPRLGKKLLVTGNGRCNLSNVNADKRHYHGENASFAEKALQALTPAATLSLFDSLGLITVKEYGGRVYPLSNQANSVLDVLRYSLEACKNVSVITDACATEVKTVKNGFEVNTTDNVYRGEKLIIACGGCAGSKAGGVTDGYTLLQSLGHSRTPLYPTLTQVRTDTSYPKALKGVRADATVSVIKNKKVIAQNTGEVQFTDTGVSGTAVFEISRCVSAGGSGLSLSFDFFKNYNVKALAAHIAATCARLPQLAANAVLTGTVNNRLGQMLCKAAGLGADTLAGNITDKQINALADICKNFTLNVTGVSGFEAAQVTAGGIKTSEFNAATMQSKIVKNLYACGEVLDIDGDCGGYNLQWAWSSGYLAGQLK